MELPVEHELLLDNLMDLPHAFLIKDGVSQGSYGHGHMLLII